MQEKIDYLALERGKHNQGSYNQAVKDLVVGIRYIREQIPGNEVKNHMPPLWEMERKLQAIDSKIGEPKRDYIKEIWDALDNEPEPDETKSFEVCTMFLNADDEIKLKATGYFFPQHIIAEEWIKENGEPSQKYVILEVIQPQGS